MTTIELHMRERQVMKIKLPATEMSEQIAALKLVQELIPAVVRFNREQRETRDETIREHTTSR